MRTGIQRFCARAPPPCCCSGPLAEGPFRHEVSPTALQPYLTPPHAPQTYGTHTLSEDLKRSQLAGSKMQKGSKSQAASDRVS